MVQKPNYGIGNCTGQVMPALLLSNLATHSFNNIQYFNIDFSNIDTFFHHIYLNQINVE